MPPLEAFERIADARSALVVTLLIAVVALAFVCRRLYRDVQAAQVRNQEFAKQVMKLGEAIYERYVSDLRGRQEVSDPPAQPETQPGTERPRA